MDMMKYSSITAHSTFTWNELLTWKNDTFIFSLCEVLKRFRKLKQSGFKIINLHPAHEAEMHALHWKLSIYWASKNSGISPPVPRRFLIKVISCWFDMTKFGLRVKQQIVRAVLFIQASRQFKWLLCSSIRAVITSYFSPDSMRASVPFHAMSHKLQEGHSGNVLITGQAMSKGKCCKFTVSVISCGNTE